MSSNLLKLGYHYLSAQDTRVIDSNAAVEMKINETRIRTEESPEAQGDFDGFTDGLNAPEVDALFETDSDAEGTVLKPPVYEGPSAEELIAQAKQEIEEMQENAEAQIREEKLRVLEQARNQGYQEGQQKAQKEAEGAKQKLARREKQLEEEYDEKLRTLEPEFISVLTDIYEHIFQVELSSYRQIIVTLIANAMHQIEGGRNYIIHVSPADYPYVTLQKAQITANSPASVSVEFTEDLTLKQNECLIETENGIFDCGLGTQLEELKQKLRLLSFER